MIFLTILVSFLESNEFLECKCQSSEEWKLLSGTPIAWLIMTHDNITMERSIRLLWKIWRSHHTYVIHVDKRVGHFNHLQLVKKIRKQFPSHDNIFVISEFDGGYACIQLVEKELEMLRTATRPWPTPQEMEYYYQNGVLPKSSENKSRLWEYAAFLSGDSYPLQDIDTIVRRISRYPSVNLVSFESNAHSVKKTYQRISTAKNGLEVLKDIESAYRICGDEEKSFSLKVMIGRVKKNKVFKRKIKSPIYWGTQWNVLTRSFATYSLTSDFALKLLKDMSHVHIPDEAYFQNLLFASCRKENISHEMFMYTPWQKRRYRRNNKYIIWLEHVESVFLSGAMFARKVRNDPVELAFEERMRKGRDHVQDFQYYCERK